MTLQGSPVFSAEDYPDIPEPLLRRLTETFDELYAALAAAPTQAYPSGSFTSEASGVSTVQVKNPLPAKPQHITVAIRRDDLADFSATWSWWWKMAGSQIQVSFIGLPASVKILYSIGVV